DDRGHPVDLAVGTLRDDLLDERQLDAVGERLQPAAGTGPVGPDPVLHAGHDLALPVDHEQGHDHAEREQHHGLEQHQPERVVGQHLGARHLLLRLGQEQRAHAAPPVSPEPALSCTAPPCPTPSASYTPTGERDGTHTTPSGRSAISAGSVNAPRSVRTVASSPATTPCRSAVAAFSRMTAGRAVPARCGSSTCSDPLSISCRQVDSFTCPFVDSSCAAAGSAWKASTVRGTAPAARSKSAHAAFGVWVNRSTSISTARVSSTRQSGSAPVFCSVTSNGRSRPSQLRNVPAFSAVGAIGSTTSARSVTADGRISKLTTKPTVSSAARAAWGSGRSSGSTPPTTSASSSPAAAAARMPAVSRPGSAGSVPSG